MSVDISRYLRQPEKRYSGVRMQQGRVILDSDWNESEWIDDEEARLTRLEILCSKGTSNNGFLISDVEPVTLTFADGTNNPQRINTYNFSIASGSMFVGGLRFEVSPDERFLRQLDWLQIDSNIDFLPLVPVDLAVGDDSVSERYDLVYLRCWEQFVTAVEDSELRERALGGPDTSARVRRMHRVEVLTDVPASCSEAFTRLLEERLLTKLPGDVSANRHVFNGADCSVSSKAKLTVTFDPEGSTDNPCKPSVTAGYLGAENQAIRIQLTQTNRFIWGYDNASPLYRVQVDPDYDGNIKVKFLNLPMDQVSQPLKGQAVEILPWGAMLPNQEKTADLTGHLATVVHSFNTEHTEKDSIIISNAVPEDWIRWLDSHSEYFSERDPVDRKRYFYLRLWTGGSGLDSQPDYDFIPGTAVGLAGTGFNVTFRDNGLPGDYWVIAARPHTPDVVVPWDLMTEASPAGTKFFYAPLALIRWSVDDDHSINAEVQDCRTKYRPLCEIGGCTTVTVGDGNSNRGDFQSLEDALDYLPGKGGLIQLLPGVHKAHVRITERKNITIRGCGKQTQVIPRESNQTDSIFYIVDSDCIKLENMDLVSFEGTAITLQGSELSALKEIDIEHNRILAYENAIKVIQGVQIRIHNNRIRMLDKQGAGMAIALWAEDSLIERNDIGVQPAASIPPLIIPGYPVPDLTDPCADFTPLYTNFLLLVPYVNSQFTVPIFYIDFAPYKALGGVVITAASERIKVLENKIFGGAGNGITLGGTIVDGDRSEAITSPDENFTTIENFTNITMGRVVDMDHNPLQDLELLFSPENVRTGVVSGTTESNGSFNVNLEPGNYRVEVISAGYQIKSIEIIPREVFIPISETHLLPTVTEYLITLEKKEPIIQQQYSFLYEIEIDRNEIAGMGLSGIGVPRIDPSNVSANHRSIAILGNPIIGLAINRNHIQDCLRDQFNVSLSSVSNRIGLGGVSLGFCEEVTISNNKIEGNGINHINPVCGIFVLFAEKIDIHHNHILDNGLIENDINAAVRDGKRGGIVVSGVSIDPSYFVSEADIDSDRMGFAVRIHENLVRQPLGEALDLLAIGPAAISNNYFATYIQGPSNLEKFIGAVFILNLGNGKELPSGLTLFSNNQTHLDSASNSLSAQFIASADDIGYESNQTNAPNKGFVLENDRSVFFNVILTAPTLRACGNRFKDSVKKGGERSITVSLMTISALLNNTNNNQGDHCIFATNRLPGMDANVLGNQVINSERCKSIFDESLGIIMERFQAISY